MIRSNSPYKADLVTEKLNQSSLDILLEVKDVNSYIPDLISTQSSPSNEKKTTSLDATEVAQFPATNSDNGSTATALAPISNEVPALNSSLTLNSSPNLNSLQSTEEYFDSTYGYGVVDAAYAVAWAAGWNGYFPDVADLPSLDNVGKNMVNAPEAWAQGYTGDGVVVAVIDSGVDWNHADLVDNIWVNSSEIVGDGIDNDGNGYTDDLLGWNFAGNNNNTLDNESHGTHVAGIIAADDNGFGATGVAPDAKIMPIKVANDRSITGDIPAAIRYAVDNGAQVINMSFGVDPTPELVDALAYAANNGVITVSAAGNEGFDEPSYPASYATDYGLSVGAIDFNWNIADFSNGAGYDPRLQHVVAPGVEIYSTVLNGSYDNKDGTSMATPFVAGVAALMLQANPYLTPNEIRSYITDSAAYIA